MPLLDELSVDENELAALCATAEPHTLLADVPAPLRPWLLPVNWDRDRLWSIHRTVSADQLGHHTIAAIILQLADLEAFLIPAGDVTSARGVDCR